jgi:hypothetical protein
MNKIDTTMAKIFPLLGRARIPQAFPPFTYRPLKAEVRRASAIQENASLKGISTVASDLEAQIQGKNTTRENWFL